MKTLFERMSERAEPIVGKVEKTLEIHSAFGSDIDAAKVDVVVLDGVRFVREEKPK